MEQTLTDRLKTAWNVFRQKDNYPYHDYGSSSSSKPDRIRFRPGTEKSIIAAFYTRIALDVSSTKIQHVKLDSDGQMTNIIHSGLNDCLNISANIDQSGRAFVQDVVMSMLDEGVAAIVPIDTVYSRRLSPAYSVRSLRVGQIIQWYPSHVKVRVYNDQTGRRQEVILHKEKVAIVENPLFAILNEPNSTLRRLVEKMSLLDAADKNSTSGKLDLIIQLPYAIKGELRKQQAENRMKAMENQLENSKYGVAYTDGTERITQLNRPVENNLLEQVEYLTKLLYNQLGLSETIFDGTATEAAITNYFARTVDPIIMVIARELHRKFLTRDAIAEGEIIQPFRDPFGLVAASQIPIMADKLTRNEIMSSNEIRSMLGLRASDDPRAAELLNKNMAARDPTAEKLVSSASARKVKMEE